MTNNPWQVEYLRATVFPSSDSDISLEKMWSEYVNKEPDSVNVQRGKLNVREVEYENGRLVLIKFEQPEKIEWRYLAKQSDEDALAFPIIGDLNNALTDFETLWSQWLASKDLFSVERIAFGAVLLKPVDNVQQGYNHLSDYLPLMNVNNLSDFHYRVNRKRVSKIIEEMYINRLTQWSVVNLNTVNIALKPNVSIQVQSSHPTSALRLELDINSSPDFNHVIPSENLESFFTELIELGVELSVEGDIE